MLRTRVIPVLLLKERGLVKGQQFKNHKYVGDPLNAVKIFNEKEVDELVFLDISAEEYERRRDKTIEKCSHLKNDEEKRNSCVYEFSVLGK